MKMMENLWQVGSVEYTLVEDARIYRSALFPIKTLDSVSLRSFLI